MSIDSKQDRSIALQCAFAFREGDLLGAGAAGDQIKGYVVGGSSRITMDYYSSGTGGFGGSTRSSCLGCSSCLGGSVGQFSVTSQE